MTAIHIATRVAMADVSTTDEIIRAAELGADIISTTLAGYIKDNPATKGPDLVLLERLVNAVEVPVFAEGRIHTPSEAAAAMNRGAHVVVVGTAITHPSTITRWFAEAL